MKVIKSEKCKFLCLPSEKNLFYGPQEIGDVQEHQSKLLSPRYGGSCRAGIFGTKYSRMDQVKFVEDSF